MSRHVTLFAALVQIVILASLAAARAAETASIEVRVSGLHNTNGKVWVCLWKEGAADGFPRCHLHQPLAKLSAPAKEPVVTFTGVEPGAYAVSMFHDEKGTGQPETNFIGLPTSAVGISNNPVIGIASPPTFAKGRFVVPDVRQLTIEARYVF